jgi:transcriptional regulator with XRE-family HTH domain
MILFRDALGIVLRSERENQCRTLRDVAASATMSLGYISEIERGMKEVSSEILQSLCDALFISVKDVLIEVVVKMDDSYLLKTNTYIEKERSIAL